MRTPALRLAGLLAIASVLLAACGGGGSGEQNCELDQCGTFEGRRWIAMKASSAPASAPWLVILHGSGVALSTMEMQWQARQFAERYGYVVVLPHAIGASWDTERDPLVILRLLDELQVEYGAPRAVFLAGWSNGSMLSQIMACRHADRISGVISHAGQLPVQEATTCVPARPVGVALMHGSHDNVVPITGGIYGLMSLEQNFNHWWGQLHCSGPDSVSASDYIDTGNLAQTTRVSGCDAPLQSTVITGGGHQPQWDANLLHPYMADFFNLSMQARGE